ncbi:PREDICTED: GATA transcription factor 20-like [Nelumbo nucifera]|uniref:GATA transcription factor 20-like n=1 Tax=Nelumbo nucifera TaxID=4432 RepID=A0A1U8BDE0_NELNU|nr:PREDICTED: GATA transcription factor 20-like [Nelumbo nucifera]
MLSSAERSSSGWDPHHHNHTYCYYDDQPHRDHDDDQQYDHHLQLPVQELKLGLYRKRPRKIPARKDEEGGEMAKVVRGKKHATEGQMVISRVCVDCKTSKTPLWRSGPAGPKSLCNACGIRQRKRRRRELNILKMAGGVTMEKRQSKVEGKRTTLHMLQRRKFEGKEEAEAALLLMALSCGVCVHS